MRYLYGLILFLSAPCFGAGQAGESISLQCSIAISSALEFIDKEQLKVDLNLQDGEFLCIGPTNNNKYILRIQNPDMGPKVKKHYFYIDANNYAVSKYSFSR